MGNSTFKQVGNNIQNVLTAQGKTQQFLAEELGVSKQVMSKIIAGSKAINVVEISKIASTLNVSVDKLLAMDTIQEPVHHFSFMGQVQKEETRRRIQFLQTVIEEILLLEEYTDARKTTQ